MPSNKRKKPNADAEGNDNDYIAICQKLKELSDITKQLNDDIKSKDSIIRDLNVALSERNTQIGERDKSIADRDKYIADLLEKISDRDTKIGDKDATIAKLIASSSSTTPTTRDNDNSSEEDKEHRRSIVISNMPEHPNQISAADRYHRDEEDIKELLNQMGVECKVQEVFRMGIRNGTKPRLIKARLQTSSQAKQAIAYAKYIGDTEYWGLNLRIRRSMTESERKEERDKIAAQREEIEELKAKYPEKKFVIYAGDICESLGYRDGRRAKPKPFVDAETEEEMNTSTRTF